MKTENLIYNSHYKHSQFNVTKKNANTSATNTTAGENPSGRLSFKGKKEIAEMTIAELEKTFGGKLAKNKIFNKFLDIINKNSLMADALIALGFTAVLRPATIYAIPSKDKETKKKNNYQVAHSVATGLLGLGTTIAVSEPLRRGIDKVLAHSDDYLKKGVLKITKDNQDVIKQTATRFHQPIFLPIRAMLTIMLVPPLLKMLGLSKTSASALNSKDKAKTDYSFMTFKGNEKRMFRNFTSTAGTPSFKGLGNVVTEGIAKGAGKIIDTKGFKKFIDGFKKTNYMPHLIAGESAILSSFYMIQTGKSDKIEKDQKLPMILNQGITAVVCGAAAYVIDGMVIGSLKKYQEVYKKLNPTMETKLLENRTKAIKMLGPLVVFTALYRFVGPVVVTPIANWISEKIEPHKKAVKAK